MANVDIRVGKKDAAFFSANPTLILKDGQFLFNSDTLELFIGDGTSQLSALVAINVPPSSGVQSVTGPQVDDTDPNNPIVNPLGLIKIVDLNGDFFTDLATATAYIEQFFSDPTIITDKSFNEGIFFFTVPENTSMDVNLTFLSNLDGVTFNTASFIDKFGLITSFLGASSFQLTNGKFIFGGDVEFTDYCFYNSNAYVEINNLKSTLGADYLFSDSNATVKIFGNIGENETANFGIDFFNTSTSTVLVNASKYTSNAGGIQGDLQTAITNGCNVFFDGIDKENAINKVISFSAPNHSTFPTTQATIDLVDNRVQSNIKIIGDWDATSGSYPLANESNTTPFITQWGATIKAGWAFRVGYGQAGTVDGFDYENGDVVYALIDSPTDNSTDWGDLDHNLQQANESLRGTAKIVSAAIVADETSTDDERIVTTKKLWLNFWTRVLAIAHTFAAKITFTTAPRFSSTTASQYLKVDGTKDLTSVAAIPATDITEDSLHRFITDLERLKINRFSYTDTVLGTVTSGTGNQFSKSVLIPANTISSGALNIKGRAFKNGSSSFGWLNIYINTTNNLSGSPKHLGQINSAGGNTLANFAIDRTIPIQAGSFVTFIVNTTNGFEEIVTNNVSTTTIDWTVDQYVILSCQCNIGTDTMRATFLSVVQH